MGFRCLIVDRPGWGGSSALDYSMHAYGTVIADVLRGVLDGLGIEQASVIGNSIGDVWALRLAARHPSMVNRVVLLGGGPIVPEVRTPGIIRVIASPIGAIMIRMPETLGRMRTILRAGGHGESLDAGRLDDFMAWRAALGRETDSMRHERGMIRAIVGGGTWRPGLTFDDAELGAIQQPTLFVFGTSDNVGSEATWRRFTGRLPRGELVVLNDAGHEPWFEDPARVASDMRRFLDR
jgi:pimeloyl-ACP methyl ester carboxylesterase